MMILYHMATTLFGFILDLILGDPEWLYHPVRLIGGLISRLENRFLSDETISPEAKRKKGIATVVIVCLTTVLVTAIILIGCYMLNPIAGIIAETLLTYSILAARSLRDESMKVYRAVEAKDLEGARKAVSMIVGRDTDSMDYPQISRAAVETIAENTSDGVIGPMLYMAIGGPILGYLYKAINTMDSMIGYKNDRYMDFGRCAAKLDDIVNYLPARISAYLMIVACFFAGKEYDVKNAGRIYKRDRYNHASPNSAHTESVCAGALGLRLAGNASYFGKVVEKPFIGDALREIEAEDIRRANRLMFISEALCLIFCLLIMGIVLKGC